MKRLCLLLTLAALLLVPAHASAETETGGLLEDGARAALEGSEYGDLKVIYDEYFSDTPFEDAVMQIVREGFSDATFEATIDSFMDGVKKALFGDGQLFLELIALLLILGVSATLNSGLTATGGASKAAGFAVLALVGALAAGVIMSCVLRVTNTTEALSNVVETATPVLVTLLTAIGGNASSALLSPAMAAVTGGIFVAVKTIVIPLAVVGSVFAIVSSVSSALRLEKFSTLMFSAGKWTLGIICAVFIAVTAVNGFTGAMLDGITVRVAKYAVSSAIPAAGPLASSAADTLAASSLLLRNALGSVSLTLIIAAVLAPLAALLANTIALRLSIAVADAFSGGEAAKLLEGAAKALSLLTGALVVCAVMAFIALGILMAAGNICFTGMT